MTGILMVAFWNTQASPRVKLLSKDTLVAGQVEEILYQVDRDEPLSLRLVVLHNFGVYSQKAMVNNCMVSFKTSSVIWDHSGRFELTLYYQDKVLSKNIITMVPGTSYAPEVEAYCGPKQILAGGEDFTMVIGSSLDSLDNPWPVGTEITYRYVFKSHAKLRTAKTKVLHSYVRFYSDNESGTPVISVAKDNSSRNEFDITIYPNHPKSFKLSYDRAHPYADGKQITTIVTNEIIDTLGNRIADGSMVYFEIKTSYGEIMQAMGTTVGGIADITLPAPAKAMDWSVRAYIEDYSQSNTISIPYLPSVKPFAIQWTKDQQLIIGPVTGFLQQYVPNYTEMEVMICAAHTEVTKTIYSREGMAFLDVGEMGLEKGTYTVTVGCGGQIKGKTIMIK